MNIKKIITFLLIFLPLIEIVLFIELGPILGSLGTIIEIFFTIIVGSYIIKQNARVYITEIQLKIMKGLRPDEEILSGIIVFLCGIMLILPGFFTDFLAIIFLIEPIRRLLIIKYSLKPSSHDNQSRKNVIDIDHTKDN